MTAAALKVFERVCATHALATAVESDRVGSAAWERHGTFCRDETAAAAARADAVLVGAVGDPPDDARDLLAGTPAERDGLMRLRQELDTYAGLRPVRSHEALLDHTPFRPDVVRGSDILVLREMCGGLMFRAPKERVVDEHGCGHALDTNLYTSEEVERVARVGFRLARTRLGVLASFDKANVMDSGILWRDCVARIGRTEFPDVRLEHYYADNAFYQMVRRPQTFDVVLADNLFGDLASDLAATVAGSLGMLPSACLPGLTGEGLAAGPGIFEPVHGSAPDIAGRGIANPVGAILSVAMLLRYAAGRADLCRAVEAAVEACLAAGARTPDLGGTATTDEMTDRILAAL